jgi:hypothetical protein
VQPRLLSMHMLYPRAVSSQGICLDAIYSDEAQQAMVSILLSLLDPRTQGPRVEYAAR